MKVGDILRLKYTMPHSREQLWKLLTDLPSMKTWYFDAIPSFEPKIGFQSQFKLENEGRSFTHKWLVADVIKNELISYDWTFSEYQGRSSSTFKIVDDLEGVALDIIIEVQDSFPEGIPEFNIKSCQGGWDWFMDRLSSVNV